MFCHVNYKLTCSAMVKIFAIQEVVVRFPGESPSVSSTMQNIWATENHIEFGLRPVQFRIPHAQNFA